MLEKVPRTLIALAVLFLPTMGYLHVQPAYQVTIMLEFQRGNPIHLCNGCIVYERLIATTANCVHVRFGPERNLTMLEPSALSVWAGSANGFSDVLQVNVSAIHVASGFNTETLENDIALLTLSQSLPLGERPDMRWIVLDDEVHVNHSCLVNFFSRNSKSAIPNYYHTEKLFLYDNKVCRKSTTHPMARKSDLCSRYILPHQFNCEEAESFLSFNNDRGSGLVCKSYLVGLLSSVVTRPDPKKNCSDVTLTAMYTNIFPHLMWIYSVMTNIETKFISTPYNASLNSFMGETATNLRDYRENEIVPTSTFLPPPQVSASILIRPTMSPTSTTTGAAPVTEGGLSPNSTVISSTPVVRQRNATSPSGIWDKYETSASVTSSLGAEGTAPTLPSTTVLAPLGGNSTTLPAGEEFLEKMSGNLTVSTVQPLPNGSSTNELKLSNATSSTGSFTATSPTFVTDGVSMNASATIGDPINSTTTADFTTCSSAPEMLGTTENLESINSTRANETIVLADISTPRASLSENATESNSPEGTTPTLNLTDTLSPSSEPAFVSPMTPAPTTGSPVLTGTPPPPSVNATKGLNSTNALVTEDPLASNPKELSSPSSLMRNASLTNLTADISSEEDISALNYTELVEPPAIGKGQNKNPTTPEIHPSLGSEELSMDRASNPSSTTSGPLQKVVHLTPATSTAPSPTLAQMRWNHTMLRPLPTVQLEPIKESPQAAVERFFRSSATSSHLNAISLPVVFLLFRLIF